MRNLLIVCAFYAVLAAPVQAIERVFAYYPFWVSYSQTKALADLPLERLDQLTYAFAYFDPQGQLQAGDAFADLNKPYTQPDGTLLRGNYALLKSYKPRYPRLKTVLAVGGWNYSAHFSSVLADPALRQRAVQSTLLFLRTHGFDGVEIDWRFPAGLGRDGNSVSPQDGANLLRFITELRAAQGNLIIGLTSGVQPAQIGRLPWAALAGQTDYVMLIATDFVGAWSNKTSHKSPLYMPAGQLSIDVAVNTLKQYGLPPGKLALMIPSQGIRFNGVAAHNAGLAQPHGGVSMGSWDNAQTGPTGIFSQDEMAALQLGQGFAEYWDEQAQVSYYYSASQQQLISIETPRALAAKLAYARQHGLLGLGLWEITSDAGDYRLLRQIEQAVDWPRSVRNDLSYWWRHHPAWVDLLAGAVLSLLLLGGAIALFVRHRRARQDELQWLHIRQIKNVVDVLPMQLSELHQLSLAAPAALADAPQSRAYEQQLQLWRESSERIAWQLAALRPDTGANATAHTEVVAVERAEADPAAALSIQQDGQGRPTPAPDASRVVAFGQFAQRLSEQRSLEKMLELTMQFLADDPLIEATAVQQLDDEPVAMASLGDQSLSVQLDDYQLNVQFKAPLSEAEQHYYRSVLDQLGAVRRSLYDLGRQPQLLAELYEIASRRDKLQFIRAEKGYSAIVAQDLRAPAYITLRLRAIRLYFDDSVLIQVHRSYLVNPKKVRAAQKRGREGWCLLIGDELIPVSRQYLPRLRLDFPAWFAPCDAAEPQRV
ncbi:glycosyl hydrolase family 18 protein [Chitinibacter sp. FCG-7]|uniref:chitinase n=1 Tax=Chitinibacter mangrovi TaxID=3153927 RepID=A0AAU7FD56_9NEIS